MSEENKNVHLPFFGIPKILPYVKKYRVRIAAMITMGIVASLIDSVFPMFTRYAIDHFIAEETLDTIGIFAVLFMAILIVQVVLNYITMYYSGMTEMDVDRDLRDASFNHLQTLSFAYFNQNNVGYIHARVMSDTGKIGELVAWRMMDIVWNGSYLIFILANMLIINARLAVYVLLLVPAAVLLISFFQKRLVTLNRKIREINSKITGDFNEGITGVKSIKTLVIEDVIGSDFKKDTSEMRRTSVHATRYSASFSAVMTMLGSAALALVLWKGGTLTKEGVMLIGTLSVFMTYAMNMMEPIQFIIETIAALIAIQVNIERFTKLMETESDVADSKEVIEKYGDTFEPKKENWEKLEGDVEFRDVSFMYPDGNEMVLENFNLKVPKGTNVAIVGETGAGKSTLVNLVCRFFEPTKGQVLIDGRDAKERSQLWLHSNIGYVLQTPHLFSGTVRDNLRYGKPDATDEEIMEALKLVSAEGVLAKMDQGLDSEVGEGGDLLSTGEKQLLSFARAILADPRILVLDEATASIDTLTEKAIQDAIATVIKGRTSFVIAHRLSTIVDADVILVVEDGKIVERGRHKELMRRKGIYYDLYTRQYEEMVVNQYGTA
ncbi:MAG: ABC transporter ATP-binding protein [Erysipelotrichaceae bacterium]|nr:ABC transporter ATP-binding protein [Erysipelotrichaceae bacterium]